MSEKEEKEWEVRVGDENSSISVDEMFAKFDEWEKNRFFLAKWIDGLFPKGIAGYRPTYSLLHPWKIVEYVSYEVKYAWQRVFKGYDERIHWSIDQWLAEIMVEVLPIFKGIKNGVPFDMFPPDMEMEHSTDEDFENAKIKFDLIIDKMARAFEIHLKELVDTYFPTDEEKKEKDEGMALFIKHLGSLWD